MRLHRLEVTAFGPYRDHQSVDFDELGSDGLFLLHGDTGAGKTTLLDAVAFALYGSVPGARNDAKRLRCDGADPFEATAVALELTVQGHRFRVRRSPEYERPKKSGDGYTKQPAKASLTWLDDPPDGQAAEGLTRIDEVTRTVQRLLGMSDAQFFQVVMLPQGEFARFLRADTAERGKLLEKLFGTEHFSAVESWFSERRKLRRRDVEVRSQRARELLARTSQVAGAEPEEGEDEQTWLEALEKRLTAEWEDAAAEQARQRRARDEADRVLTERRDLADKVRRVRHARSDLAELEKNSELHAAWRSEKDAAERAASVVAVNETARRAEQERDRAFAELATVEAECAGIDAEATVEQLRESASALRSEAGALSALLPEVRQQETDTRRLAELIKQVEADEREELALAERQAELPARVTEAREKVDEAKQASALQESADARVEELTALSRAAKELPQREAASSAAAKRAGEAVDAHQQARDRLQDLRERRLAGMAAELASGLTGAEPCPVCGSPEHPNLASPVDDAVSSGDEESAQLAEQQAHARREAATAEARQAEEVCERLREKLGERTEDELAAELATGTAHRDAQRDLAGQLRERSDNLAELEAAAERISSERGELRTRIASTRSEHSALQTTVDEREERLRGARGEHPSIAERRSDLLAAAAQAESLLTARAAGDDAVRHADAQLESLRSAATDAGFSDVDAALAARRDEQRLAELTEAVAGVDERFAVARAALAEFAEVDPDVEVRLDEAVEAATAARERAEQATARARSAEQRHGDVAGLAERLRAAWVELGPALAEFAELDALTDVVNGQGQNARKMSLRSYVLAARLEEVAVAATRRLQRMSAGRYSFVHTDAAGARGTRGGLGLDILDDYSGKVRPAKTLSGGESFLASLSLALGLADVVAAETGGALLDTLFIDEGFGTLDAGTLDLVMDTLDELRAGGRVIGVVSHVEELRQRIGIRLRVGKSRSGSTLVVES